MANLPEDARRRVLLPFYEASSSNNIEGTEFTLEEASEIALGHVVPEQRPQDAHDVVGTHALTSAPEEMRRLPRSAEELLELIRARHAVILGGRPDW